MTGWRATARAASRLLALIGLALGLGGQALAAPACTAPADLAPPQAAAPHEGEAPRTLPIGGYTLATAWMPQHCRRAINGIAAVECGRPEVRAAGLTLHGLWPDGVGRDWPQWCAPAAILSPRTIAAGYCATPSAQLMQHEWAKHGTCMAGYTPDRYFARADALFAAIRVPDLRALSYGHATVASVKRAVADLNPGVGPETMALNLDRQGWLQEIWFCLDTNFRPRACAAGRREQPDDAVLIWRGGGRTGADAARGRGGDRYGYGRRYER